MNKNTLLEGANLLSEFIKEKAGEMLHNVKSDKLFKADDELMLADDTFTQLKKDEA